MLTRQSKNGLPKLVIGAVAVATIVGIGLMLSSEVDARGPRGGLDVKVVNDQTAPVPVVGHVNGDITGTVQSEQSGYWLVGAEQVGEWEVSIPDGVAIDPWQNQVRIQKGTRLLDRREIRLDADNPEEEIDIDLTGATKIRVTFVVNGSEQKAKVFLGSKWRRAPTGSSYLDEWTVSPVSTRVYELPGERLEVVITRAGGGSRQVFMTIWGN